MDDYGDHWIPPPQTQSISSAAAVFFSFFLFSFLAATPLVPYDLKRKKKKENQMRARGKKKKTKLRYHSALSFFSPDRACIKINATRTNSRRWNVLDITQCPRELLVYKSTVANCGVILRLRRRRRRRRKIIIITIVCVEVIKRGVHVDGSIATTFKKRLSRLSCGPRRERGRACMRREKENNTGL